MRVLVIVSVLVAALCLMDMVDAKKRFRDEYDDFEEDEEYDSEDREAMMGKDETEAFDSLSKKEKKKSMGIIFGKMDKDSDGFVTGDELENWINIVMKKSDADEMDTEWKKYKLANDTGLSWDVYAKKNNIKKSGEKVDKQKWTMADLDKDGKLSKGEFTDYLQPEGKEHMREGTALETFSAIDKDGDGNISLKEYLNNVNPAGSNKKKQPKWVSKEVEKFNEIDTDKDGKVTLEQIKDLIAPPGFDYAKNEAKLLMKKSDKNKDGKLSKDEVLKKQSIFVESEATAHGDALVYHDEF